MNSSSTLIQLALYKQRIKFRFALVNNRFGAMSNKIVLSVKEADWLRTTSEANTALARGQSGEQKRLQVFTARRDVM